MLAGDHNNSVLSQVSEGQVKPVAYMAYGYNRVGGGGLRFNGEYEEAHTGGYLLGMGFRAYNPVLMRFNSPDGFAWSPFGEGGINAYGYVKGDPVSWVDPSGHWPRWLRRLFGGSGRRSDTATAAPKAGRSSDNRSTRSESFSEEATEFTQFNYPGGELFKNAKVVHEDWSKGSRTLTFKTEYLTFQTEKKAKGRERFVGITARADGLDDYASIINGLVKRTKYGGFTYENLRKNLKVGTQPAVPQVSTQAVRQDTNQLWLFKPRQRKDKFDY